MPKTALHEFNQGLLQFIQQSPTPFHAVAAMASQLRAAGFAEIHEADAWQLVTGNKYFLTRNDSSIIAFVYGKKSLVDAGIRMFGAHTDSPCLKVRPVPELFRKNYFQLGVEIYGGVLLAPWFDRDLSLAGRVTYQTADKKIASVLIDFKTAVATVPSLAIHLDRDANSNRSINAQKEIIPLLLQLPSGSSLKPSFNTLLNEQFKKEHPTIVSTKILDYEISCYDTQAPALIGLQKDFISSARLDNLLSCYVGLQALLNTQGDESQLLICTDHEEVGSTSCCGAKGPFLQQFLERLIPDTEWRARSIEKSFFISADNAHAQHPNYLDKHDENHAPLLNAGPVIKVNANQRYATTSETSALIKILADNVQIPLQEFVARSDMGCGSTIGPIVSSEIGVKTIDLGVPTFAMHSIRELAGVNDAYWLFALTKEFFANANIAK